MNKFKCASSFSFTGEVGDAPLNNNIMQVITTYTEQYVKAYGTIYSSTGGVKSVKLRAANGNTICIHEINGELVIKNE